MIITEISQVDRLAERMLSNDSDIVSLDVKDYDLIKQNSTSLQAVTVEIPSLDKAGIAIFANAIKDFEVVGAGQALLQFCGKSNNIEENISLNEMNSILGVFEAHFGKVNMIWGLTERKNAETAGYLINVIVGYK